MEFNYNEFKAKMLTSSSTEGALQEDYKKILENVVTMDIESVSQFAREMTYQGLDALTVLTTTWTLLKGDKDLLMSALTLFVVRGQNLSSMQKNSQDKVKSLIQVLLSRGIKSSLGANKGPQEITLARMAAVFPVQTVEIIIKIDNDPENSDVLEKLDRHIMDPSWTKMCHFPGLISAVYPDKMLDDTTFYSALRILYATQTRTFSRDKSSPVNIELVSNFIAAARTSKVVSVDAKAKLYVKHKAYMDKTFRELTEFYNNDLRRHAALEYLGLG